MYISVYMYIDMGQELTSLFSCTGMMVRLWGIIPTGKGRRPYTYNLCSNTHAHVPFTSYHITYLICIYLHVCFSSYSCVCVCVEATAVFLKRWQTQPSYPWQVPVNRVTGTATTSGAGPDVPAKRCHK